ncbi:MAG: SAM-dependent methyltransferase [Alphaproteobacteria bacterium]
MTTPLAKLLIQRIRATGPITLADFMSDALGHPRYGYYTRFRTSTDPFGAQGDFITAPEVSQVFGELIGLWTIDFWQRLGNDAPLHLVELGPGRGTMMLDMIRVITRRSEFQNNLTVHLVETSPLLQSIQRQHLEKCSVPLMWYESLAQVPGVPCVFIANEFIDALPRRQFQYQKGAWREVMVGLTHDENLTLGLVPGITPMAKFLPENAKDNDIVEWCPAAVTMVEEMARRLNQFSGAALFIDYGYMHPSFQSTVQALQNHRAVNILADPGLVDISAHVDFMNLVDMGKAKGLKVYGPVTQGEFLKRLGIEVRCDHLIKAVPEKAEVVQEGVTRLIDPAQMGTLFKVLAYTIGAAPHPAGFQD